MQSEESRKCFERVARELKDARIKLLEEEIETLAGRIEYFQKALAKAREKNKPVEPEKKRPELLFLDDKGEPTKKKLVHVGYAAHYILQPGIIPEVFSETLEDCYKKVVELDEESEDDFNVCFVRLYRCDDFTSEENELMQKLYNEEVMRKMRLEDATIGDPRR